MIDSKKRLDKQRTEWRKKHRTLNGRIILYPEKSPEHINARASKVHNWFWKKILLELSLHEIPAIISGIKDQIKSEQNREKLILYRTMIGMAEDAYSLKRLENIKDYDAEIGFSKNIIYSSSGGILYKNGRIFTVDYSEDESKILIRDIEGIVIDAFFSDNNRQKKQ